MNFYIDCFGGALVSKSIFNILHFCPSSVQHFELPFDLFERCYINKVWLIDWRLAVWSPALNPKLLPGRFTAAHCANSFFSNLKIL